MFKLVEWVAHKSLTDFILDAAYKAAEHTLLDQRLFMVSGTVGQIDTLDAPERIRLGMGQYPIPLVKDSGSFNG